MRQERIIVTGSQGFVGRSLCKKLQERGIAFVGVGRSASPNDGNSYRQIHAINGSTDWAHTLNGAHVVIHLAAKVHVMRERSADPLAAYRETNLEGTLNLARQAVLAGVKRFIFVSSIKVNGEETVAGHPFHADDSPRPEDAYAISKCEAENALLTLANETGMEVVIIRPPLVYGPGVKGNFATMIKLLNSGIPLPFGFIDNCRSLVGIDNLIHLLITCIDHPRATNQVFLVSDGEDLSTPDLLRRLAKAAGVPSRLLPIPAICLKFFLKILGQKKMAGRILGSLQVDISKTREVLGWQPPLTVNQGLRNCFSTKAEP